MSAKPRARDCKACERDALEHQKGKPGKTLKEIHGCAGYPRNEKGELYGCFEFFWDDEFGNGPIERCPIATLKECEWWIDFRDAYQFRKNGLFPAAGGWADQAGKLIEAIQCFDNEMRSYVRDNDNS